MALSPHHPTVRFWKQHIEALKSTNTVSENGLNWLRQLAQPANFGGEMGQLREDQNLSQWDVYYSLPMYGVGNEAERLLLSGLGAGEVAHENERQQMLHSFGLDIDSHDDQDELAFIASLDGMSAPQLDKLISDMKKLI